MAQREIASEQWQDVIDQFGRLHRGRPVRITLNAPAVGTHLYSADQPLLGLVDEHHGQADESITVMWGGMAQGTFSHRISRPARLSFSEWNDACSAKLEIDSAEGQRLTIEAGPVEQTLPPGLVTDGFLLEQPS